MEKYLTIALALCLNAQIALAADFAAGAKAYDGGRYAAAFAVWHALAKSGDVRAQVAIAGMYRFGEGRAIDVREAARWYRRAADAGDPIAQLNYAEMLERGVGMRQDRKAALHWYAKAANQGNGWAAEQIRRLTGQ